MRVVPSTGAAAKLASESEQDLKLAAKVSPVCHLIPVKGHRLDPFCGHGWVSWLQGHQVVVIKLL